AVVAACVVVPAVVVATVVVPAVVVAAVVVAARVVVPVVVAACVVVDWRVVVVASVVVVVTAAELHDCVETGRNEYVVDEVTCLLCERPEPCPCNLVSVVVATTTYPQGA